MENEKDGIGSYHVVQMVKGIRNKLNELDDSLLELEKAIMIVDENYKKNNNCENIPDNVIILIEKDINWANNFRPSTLYQDWRELSKGRCLIIKDKTGYKLDRFKWIKLIEENENYRGN